jgi:RHS repeat-associated protein
VAQIYFIHTDHLNTPRLITNNVGQAVWSWNNDDPFGANVPNQNPSALGDFTCNLRLPGQYFDRETNLHYNYFRDYAPIMGRYLESDPIGLRAGTNTYTYALNNPIRHVDREGLDVTVTYFPGFPGHIGIAINSSDTVGLYPKQRGIRVALCGTVAGVIDLDRNRQDPKYVARSQSITVRTAAWQDRLMQDRINSIGRNTPTYNLCVDQCTTFVASVLRAGGVFFYSFAEEATPLGLIQQLQGIYGEQ